MQFLVGPRPPQNDHVPGSTWFSDVLVTDVLVQRCLVQRTTILVQGHSVLRRPGLSYESMFASICEPVSNLVSNCSLFQLGGSEYSVFELLELFD